ncbi:MAG: DNA replication protein DnaC [Halomonas sp.]|nr:DNA replication protein DnaC [Halomonas sp.]|tara:strand:- start:13104 stop:13910 length:807 start_codon:yes stop_codon:yes gene_type:complete
MEHSDPKSTQNILGFTSLDEKKEVCEKHGEFTATLLKFPGQPEPRWTTCQACFREDMKNEERQMAVQLNKENRERKIRFALGRAAIPTRFADRQFDNYVCENEGQTKAFNSAKRYAEQWEEVKAAGRCLIMVGKPGTGKTHLAIAIARAVLATDDVAMYVRASEAISTVTETYSRDNQKTERQALDSFAVSDLLIIDEVGRQRGTDNERMILFEIINRRYEEGKPTIIISNLDLVGLRGYMDEATEDRLREGGGRAIDFNWESYRSKV